MVVLTRTSAALTSTLSVTSPTSSRASMVACCWTASVNVLLENFLKPAASTVSTYWPGGSADTTNRPSRSATVVWLVPRSASVMVTAAWGTAEPEESLAVPRTVAVKDWPKARLADSSKSVRLRNTPTDMRSTATDTRREADIASLPCWAGE